MKNVGTTCNILDNIAFSVKGRGIRPGARYPLYPVLAYTNAARLAAAMGHNPSYHIARAKAAVRGAIKGQLIS